MRIDGDLNQASSHEDGEKLLDLGYVLNTELIDLVRAFAKSVGILRVRDSRVQADSKNGSINTNTQLIKFN